MYFEIQISNPLLTNCLGDEVQDLCSAIVRIFPEVTEDVILIWNWIPVKINYNADLSVMIEDIMIMLSNIISSDRGNIRTYFGANTFRVEWLITWANGIIEIYANWDSVAGSYENLLNSRNYFNSSVKDFLNEWKALLRKIISSIELSGVQIIDKDEFVRLKYLETNIHKHGKLYKDLDEFE
jgi:hypothetical protein